MEDIISDNYEQIKNNDRVFINESKTRCLSFVYLKCCYIILKNILTNFKYHVKINQRGIGMKKVIIGLFILGTMVIGGENLDTSLDKYSKLIAKVIDKTELVKKEKTIDNVLAVEQAMTDTQAERVTLFYFFVKKFLTDSIICGILIV